MSATPSKLYESTLRTLAVPAGPPRRRFPLPKSSPIQFAAYAFDQELEMVLMHPTSGAVLFPPAPKNTPSSATGVFAGLLDANAILTSLSQPSPTGGGRGRFTGSFARVPASWDDFETQTVTFPGIRDFAYQGGVRDPKSWNVTMRVRKDYFVVDPAGVLTGLGVLDSGGSAITVVTSKSLIPTVPRTPFGFLVSSAMLTTSEVTGLVKSGGITGWFETVPNTSQYQAWIAYAVAHGWTGTVWDGTLANVATSTISQFCFQDSHLQDWEGNIIERTSYFALAQ